MIGLSRFYMVRAEFQTARELGLQLLDLAQHVQDPTLLMGAHWAVWLPAFYEGGFLEVDERAQRCLDLYDRQQHPAQVLMYGLDLGVACHEWAALSAWLLGYPDRARAHQQEGLSLAQELAHPYSEATALVYAAWLYQLCGEGARAQEWAETAMARCAEQGFAYWLAMATIFRGWALADQSQSALEAVQMLHEGIITYRATGATMACTYWLGLQSDVYGRQGQPEPALAAVGEALGLIDKTGECFWEAELRRLQGECLLLQSAENHERAETCFDQALDVARHQQAKSLELRAAMSLARLWRQQEKPREAYDLLAPVYGWFTEGLDTADLKDAKTLLDELEK